MSTPPPLRTRATASIGRVMTSHCFLEHVTRGTTTTAATGRTIIGCRCRVHKESSPPPYYVQLSLDVHKQMSTPPPPKLSASVTIGQLPVAGSHWLNAPSPHPHCSIRNSHWVYIHYYPQPNHYQHTCRGFDWIYHCNSCGWFSLADRSFDVCVAPHKSSLFSTIRHNFFGDPATQTSFNGNHGPGAS